MAQMIVGCPVIDEARDLITELTMFDDLVGHQPAEVTRPSDQDALEADTGAPATFEDVAYEFTRRETEDDVQDQAASTVDSRLHHYPAVLQARERFQA